MLGNALGNILGNQLGNAISDGIGPGAPAPTVSSVVGTLYGGTNFGGSHKGGTAVTIAGTGFTGATSGTVGGAALTSFTVVNDTTITAVTPAGTLGSSAIVAVTGPGGVGSSGSGVALGGWTYFSPLTIATTKLANWWRTFTINGSTVSAYVDSVAGADMVQGTALLQPDYEATGVNGIAPAAHSNGTTTYLRSTTLTGVAAGARPSLWAVGQFVVLPGGGQTARPVNVSSAAGEAATQPDLSMRVVNANATFFGHFRAEGAIAGPNKDTNLHLFELHQRAVTANKFVVDGVGYAGSATAALANDITTAMLGCTIDVATPARFGNWREPERFLLNALPTAGEELALRAYFRLNTDYGFTF